MFRLFLIINTNCLSNSKLGALLLSRCLKLWCVAVLSVAFVVLTACTGAQFRVPANGWTAIAAEEIAAADGTLTTTRLYVGTRDGEVLALDPTVLNQAFVGSSSFERAQIEGVGLVWSFKPDIGDDDRELGGVFGKPAIDAQRVYVGFSTQDGEMGILYALNKDRDRRNLSNMELNEWQAEVQGKIVGGPVLAPDLGLVVVGTDAGIVYGYDISSPGPSPRLEFQYPLPGDTIGPIWSTPLIRGNTAYFGSLDHNIYAISLNDGTRLAGWPFETAGGIMTQPLLVGDQLVVGSFDRNLYGIDASSGTGRVLVSADKWFWGGAVSDGSNTFVSSLNGQIFVLDRDGNKMRELAVQGPVVARPTTISSGGRTWVVMANEDGVLHLVSESEDITDVLILEGSRIKAPLVSVGRELFLSKEDGTVWALRLTGNTFEKLWSLDTTT